MTPKSLINQSVYCSEKIKKFEEEQAQAFLDFLKKNATTYSSVKKAIAICKRNAEWNNSEQRKRFLDTVENALERELGSLPVTDCQELVNALADNVSQKIADELEKSSLL